MEWLDTFLKLAPTIGKVIAFILGGGILVDWSAQKLKRFSNRASTASKTIVDLEEVLTVSAKSMAQSNKILKEQIAENTDLRQEAKKYKDLYASEVHKNGRLATYTAGTIQFIQAHNKMCSCDNDDLREYHQLLQKAPRSIEYIHRFEELAIKYDLYQANRPGSGK